MPGLRTVSDSDNASSRTVAYVMPQSDGHFNSVHTRWLTPFKELVDTTKSAGPPPTLTSYGS